MTKVLGELSLLLGALLWAGLAHAQSDATTHELDSQLLKQLHVANQLEIAAGKLAQSQTPTPGVKKFGAKLIADHTASDDEVVAIAKDEGVELAPPPEAPLAELRDLKGAKFDRAFALLMVKDHESAVQQIKAAHEEPHGARVRALIDKILPVLQKHLKHAQQLENPLPHP
jgi:putative membrane protein